MIVDDKKENIYLYETILKGNGYEIASAMDGRQALEKLRSDSFDIIVSDIMMPVMDGFRFCQECKKDKKLKDIPFIFITANYTDIKDEALALKLGVDRFVRKPIDPDALINIVQDVIKDNGKDMTHQQKPITVDNVDVLKLYDECLVHKLEEKLLELEKEIILRKKLEEELKENRDYLDNKVKERTADLQKANEQLQKEITERKKGEELIRYQAGLVDNVSDAIISFDINFNIITWNKAAEEIYGWKADEVIGKNAEGIIPVTFLNNEYEGMLNEFFEEGHWAGEVVQHHRDGRLLHILSSSMIIYDSGGERKGIVTINRDITERRQFEEEHQKAAKIESIGTLAGGIAHDFNNLLTAIMGNIGLAKRYVEPGEEVYSLLDEAEKVSIRAGDLTQQLLTFSRGGAPVKNTVSIGGLLNESAGFALRGSNIRCDFDLPDNLWATDIDEGQINQLITNMVINAQEAMSEGGVINIKASNTVVEGKTTLPLSKGRYIEITIEDHGIGMKKEHLDRIFDPYFTTKQKGIGLGLTTSYSIVKAHEGHITVESTPTVGTTFHIYLPASKKRIPKKKELEAIQPTLLSGGRILVLDDEEIIREMLSRMLLLAGYEVTLTSDGAEAIEQYAKAKESGKPFDTVIMDLTIPGGMGGKEAIKELIKIDPNVKAIVSSGYSTDPIMSEYKKYGFSGVITKPYSVEQLEKTLSSILKGKK